MKHSISFKIALLSLSFLIGGVNAQPNPTPTPSQRSMNIPQFYAGISGGFEHFTGHRSEKLISTDPANSESRVFSDNKKFFSNADIALSGIAGFLWKIPNLPFSIGPEVYLGQGNGRDLIKNTYRDNLAAETRTYSAELKRKLFYGFIVRAGWNFWKDYFGFLSLGIDSSQFMADRLMITDTNNINGSNSNTLRKTKRLSGTVMGIGFEKRFGSLCVGIDLKRIAYKSQRLFDTLNPDPGINPNQLAFSVRPKIYSLSLRLSYLF